MASGAMKTETTVDVASPKNVSPGSSSQQGQSKTQTRPAPKAVTADTDAIRLVIQRFRTASLLVNDETHVVTVAAAQDDSMDASSSRREQDHLIHPSTTANHYASSSCGLLVYVSFAKSADRAKVKLAARTLLNLPVLTYGAWGDGSDTMSVLDMAHCTPDIITTRTTVDPNKQAPVAVLLVPQANLISKVKQHGRSIQYHGQVDRATGETLYEYFVDCVKGMVLLDQYEYKRGGHDDDTPTPPKQLTIPEWLKEYAANDTSKHSTASTASSTGTTDPSIPPQDLFRRPECGYYSSFDDSTGLPLTNQHGEPLSKSAMKKLRKVMDAHRKRHEKYLSKKSQHTSELLNVEVASECGMTNVTDNFPDKKWSDLDDSYVHIASGSFGRRQALEFVSDMGPFCHVVNL